MNWCLGRNCGHKGCTRCSCMHGSKRERDRKLGLDGGGVPLFPPLVTGSAASRVERGGTSKAKTGPGAKKIQPSLAHC